MICVAQQGLQSSWPQVLVRLLEPPPPTLLHAGRQLDLGERNLNDGPDIALIALDLCVSASDSGTGKIPAKYKTGATGKCEAKSNLKAKRKNLKYMMARFNLNGIDSAELCCPLATVRVAPAARARMRSLGWCSACQ